MTLELFQTQSPAPHLSVSVWREQMPSRSRSSGNYLYRKIWKDENASKDSAWLSWAHHEHLMLSLLSQRFISNVVKVSGLQVGDTQVDLVTVDAGPEFLRNWLLPSRSLRQSSLWRSEIDALKWIRVCLKTLLSLHEMGVIHGDLKPDNLCVSRDNQFDGTFTRMNLQSLTLIDFAYALYREAPLRFVLPTDPLRLDYLPDFYRQAIQTAQNTQNPNVLMSVACVNIDLFSLACLLKQTTDSSQASEWPNWLTMMDEIEQFGRQQQKPFSLLGKRLFDQPTRLLLKRVESFLHDGNVPREQWDWADTVLTAQVADTPLLLYPAPTVDPTPLINWTASLDKPLTSASALSVMLAHKKSGHFPRKLILSSLSLDALIFYLIDRSYHQHQWLLTNSAYYWGLISLVLGTLLVVQTVRFTLHPQSTNLNRWLFTQASLVCAAVFYVLTLPLAVHSVLVIALLAAQVWAMSVLAKFR